MARKKNYGENQGLLPFDELSLAPIDTWYTMSEAAGLIGGMGRNKLFELLRNENLIGQKNEPCPIYSDKGYFKIEHVPRYYTSGLLNDQFSALRVSPKGIDSIIKLIKTKEKKNGTSQ